MENTVAQPINPLAMYMRQPKIYIRLPSNGEYWAPGSLDITENGQYPVYSMTAKDELLIKVPDALMSGQAIVDVIQNCMPNIKNAWCVPNLDLDIILIAIRLATYGEYMETPIKFGELELQYSVDLRIVMDNLMKSITWDPVVAISDDMTVFVKPVTYKEITKVSTQSFETQRILQVVGNETLSDEEKLRMFQESFKKLTESTMDIVSDSISSIQTTNGSTSDANFIKDFLANSDKSIFNKIQNHLEKMRETNTVKPLNIQVTDEMREAGVEGESIEVPLTFDASTFFV
jgi:hypothetical protein